MKWEDARRAFLKGKKIRRKSWKDGEYINICSLVSLFPNDFYADDWEIKND